MSRTAALTVSLFLLLAAACRPPSPGAPAEPLVPTPPAARLSPAPPAATADLPLLPPSDRERFGVGVPVGPIIRYPVERLGVGWYLNWQVEMDPPQFPGLSFWQMVRVSEEGFRPDPSTIRAAAQANPGSTWLVGNEPDVVWQDNSTPERYAEIYREVYRLIKSVDPSAQVAIAGVAQPSPLRLAYLDRVLAAYQERYGEPMPVDLWNVHNFILREEEGSWGVGIPPGMGAAAGIRYEVQDHDNLDIFREQVLTFRRWMAERGQQDRPLAVSEYGVVMPADYGFDPARVEAFMTATFDFFLTATDAEVGYPADGYRLVQWWCWYSLADTMYPTGNLFDPLTGEPTLLGAAFARYRPPEEAFSGLP